MRIKIPYIVFHSPDLSPTSAPMNPNLIVDDNNTRKKRSILKFVFLSITKITHQLAGMIAIFIQRFKNGKSKQSDST